MVSLPFGDRLPVEMQRMIFGNVESDMLLESRLVCKDWKNFVDDNNMEPKIWKPYFPENDVADNILHFMGKRSRNWTKFSSSEQLEEMLDKYACYGPLTYDEDQHVESTCRQLIFQFQSIPDYTGVCRLLSAFVARFGNVIRNLVYLVHDKVPESITSIPAMFAQMTNIESLVIYCHYWVSVQYLLKRTVSHNNTAFQLPAALRNITVRGNASHVFLSYLLTSRRPRVKQLKVWGLNYGVLDQKSAATLFACGLHALPNVEELKLCNPSNPELLALARWPVKRLSLKMESTDCLGGILESIEKFAGTLEYLHVQITQKQIWSHTTCFNDIMAFPNVREVRFPYFVETRLGYLTEMKRIFPNMKHLQLVDNGNQIQQAMLRAAHNNNDKNPLQAIKDVLVPFWEQLPDGLEMISVRYRDYKKIGDAARRYSYTVHKYYEKKERQVPLNCN